MLSDDDVGNRREHRVTAARTQDPFDRELSSKIGLPNGAYIKPKVVQYVDFYGNSTDYNVQSAHDGEGVTVFIKQHNVDGAQRFILPPAVLAMIDRQRASLTKQIRRRHGQRIAEQRAATGQQPGFMKRKAA